MIALDGGQHRLGPPTPSPPTAELGNGPQYDVRIMAAPTTSTAGSRPRTSSRPGNRRQRRRARAREALSSSASSLCKTSLCATIRRVSDRAGGRARLQHTSSMHARLVPIRARQPDRDAGRASPGIASRIAGGRKRSRAHREARTPCRSGRTVGIEIERPAEYALPGCHSIATERPNCPKQCVAQSARGGLILEVLRHGGLPKAVICLRLRTWAWWLTGQLD